MEDEPYIKKYMQIKYAPNITSPDGVSIDHSVILFALQSAPGLPLVMYLPQDITKMDALSAKAKYPSDDRPDIILTMKEDESINFLFTHTERPMTDDGIPEVVQGVQTVIKRMRAGAQLGRSGVIQAGSFEVHWFDYVSAALDDDIYNLMYFMCLEGRLLIGSFCCLKKYHEEWKSVVLQCIQSIQDAGGEERGEQVDGFR